MRQINDKVQSILEKIISLFGINTSDNSFSVTPASDIPDETYIGDIKFGESLPSGTNIIGNVGISGNYISGSIVGTDNIITFENSAAANTQVNVDISKPNNPKSRYLITVYNPSIVTDLTVKIFTKETSFGGDTRYGYLDVTTIPKSQTVSGTIINTYVIIVEGIFIGADLRLTFSNNTALGASDGFSAYVRVREII